LFYVKLISLHYLCIQGAAVTEVEIKRHVFCSQSMLQSLYWTIQLFMQWNGKLALQHILILMDMCIWNCYFVHNFLIYLYTEDPNNIANNLVCNVFFYFRDPKIKPDSKLHMP